jgi:hypothetical protein
MTMKLRQFTEMVNRVRLVKLKKGYRYQEENNSKNVMCNINSSGI